jgi:acyl-CoA synthetase (NDP forming)
VNDNQALGRWLPEAEVKGLLAQRGVSIPKGLSVADAVAARRAVRDLRPPLILKLVSPDLVHKSDVGGIRFDINSALDAEQAAESLIQVARDRGLREPKLLLEEQCPPGLEMIVGAIVDQHFGPVVMIGLGGIWVEALNDVAYALAPLSTVDILRSLTSLRAWPLLTGGRGQSPIDIDALTKLLLVVGGPSGLVFDPDFEQLDLNPVIVRNDRVVVVDAKLSVKQGSASLASEPSFLGGGLDHLFKPTRLGLVGASSDQYVMPANFILRAYRESRRGRELFCVSPDRAPMHTIDEVPCFPTLAAAGGHVDLLTLALPADEVLVTLRELKGTIGVVHITANTDSEPAIRATFNSALLESAKASGTRVLGPNCLGVHCPAGAISFVRGARMELGSISVVSQSGSFAAEVVNTGEVERLRFAKVLSIGDAIDINTAEVLGYLLDDPETACIGLHLETAAGGRRIYEQILARAGRKPIVILKGGMTDQGGRAAGSHTGALVGDPILWRTLERQAGVSIVSRVQDFFAALKFFDRHLTGLLQPRTAVLLFGGAGGFGVLGSDSLGTAGIDVPPLTPPAQTQLRDSFGAPRNGSYGNPLDMSSEPESFASILGHITNTDYFSDVVIHFRIANAYRFSNDPDETVNRLITAVRQLPTQLPGVRFSLVLNGAKNRPDAAKRVHDDLASSPIAVVDSFDEIAAGLRAAAIHSGRWAADR